MPVHSKAVGNQLRQAGREDSHGIPAFEIPDGWQRNEPMCCPDRTEIGLRNGKFTRFIEVHSVEPLATIDGPYYAELREQYGGDDSFETRPVRRITGIEPGGVQEAVDALADGTEVPDDG